MDFKAQSSIEYLAVVGLGLLMATPFIGLVQEDVISLKTDSQDARFTSSLDEMESAIERANALGASAQTSFVLNVPDNIQDAQVVGNKNIVFTQNRSGELTNYTRIFENNISALDIPSESGSYRMKAEASDNEVLIGYRDTKIFAANSRSSWNQGDFDGASADRNSHSGKLGIGYLDGTNPSSTNLENGLIGYWRFDSNVLEGESVKDYSENRNDGVNEGASSGQEGIFSTNSFEFNDSDQDIVTVDHDSSLNPGTNPMSISVWIKPDDYSDGGLVVKKNDGYKEGYRLKLDNDFLKFFVEDLDGDNAYIDDSIDASTDPINLDEWNHVVAAFERESNGIKLYVNGEMVAEGADSGDPTLVDSIESNVELRIGRDWTGNDNGDYFDGEIDEPRIYHQSLTESDVKDLYFNGRPFKGNYTSKKIENNNEVQWDKLEINASVPSETDLTAKFEALDSSDNVVDQQSISVESGKKDYSLNVQDSVNGRVSFEGSSSDATKSWSVSEILVFY